MEIATILPSYRNLLGTNNKEVTKRNTSKSKADEAKDKLKPKDSGNSISGQNNGRVVDVSI